MGFRMRFAAKAKSLFVASPTKEKPLNLQDPLGGFDPKRPDFGSREEIFFDSSVWLDSDCEDDFFSVNGDFTPSRGNTPNHQAFAPRMNGGFLTGKFPDTKSKPSPPGKSKLSDLLQESTQGENPGFEHNVTKGKSDMDPKANGYMPGSEVTPNREMKKEKAWKTGHCCLPNFVQGFGATR